MTPSRYPLCEKAGLKVEPNVYRQLQFGEEGVIRAADVEALLANASVVVSVSDNKSGNWFKNDGHIPASDATHTARLVCIEELKQESEEIKLLRQIAEWKEWDGVPDQDGKCNNKPTLYDLKDRARAFLERKERV